MVVLSLSLSLWLSFHGRDIGDRGFVFVVVVGLLVVLVAVVFS